MCPCFHKGGWNQLLPMVLKWYILYINRGNLWNIPQERGIFQTGPMNRVYARCMLEDESGQINKSPPKVTKGTWVKTFKPIFGVIFKKLSNCPNVFWILGLRRGKKWKKSISREPLIIETWLTPHFDQKSHFPISVSYIICPSNHQKCLKIDNFVKIMCFQ